jgi:hypothetical protein
MTSKTVRRVVGALVALALVLALPVGGAWLLHAGWAWPTHDASTLKAIRAESDLLMKTFPVSPRESSGDSIAGRDFVDVPKNRWPPVIASLRPYFVTVFPYGVHIYMKPDFDGGWSYFVFRNRRDKPDWGQPYSDLGQGVYWMSPG